MCINVKIVRETAILKLTCSGDVEAKQDFPLMHEHRKLQRRDLLQKTGERDRASGPRKEGGSMCFTYFLLSSLVQVFHKIQATFCV